MNVHRLSIEEYMKVNKVKSRQTIYNRIQSGQLKSEKIDNRLYIILDNEKKESVKEDWTTEIIKKTISDKDGQIEELKKKLESAEEEKKKSEERAEKEKEVLNKRLDTAENEKKELLERNREQNHLLMQSVKNTELLTNQVKELEYKVEEGQEKKGFWKRVFGEKK
ncbi:MAG: hypothetical protein KBA67_08730 [Leptotrichiaceae bacterium]|nr:hypothetical protein [Leptotrichiaceae bacterium]